MLKRIKEKFRCNNQKSHEDHVFSKDCITPPRTLQICELIPCKNHVVLHGRIIIDKRIPIDNVSISCLGDRANPISSDYLRYENSDYFDNEECLKNKRAIEFSIKIPKGSQDVAIRVYDLETNEDLEPSYLLGRKEYAKLVDKHRRVFPDIDTLIDLQNRNFEIDRSTKEMLDLQKEIQFDFMPKFSIIVPLFNTPLNYFNDMAMSVLNQSYENWELILVNATPNNLELNELIETFEDLDHRVKEVRISKNLGIMLNTKAGVDTAKGDYVSFLDHDDMLEPDTLYYYVKAINAESEYPGLLYCDESIIHEDGSLAGSFLVGNYSKDALINRNYICHFLAIKKTILDEIDLNTSEFDGAQDHYMTLQAVLKSDNIVHVNKVLYHWRRTKKSTATDLENKIEAYEAGKRCINGYLSDAGINAKVISSEKPFTYPLKYLLPEDTKTTAIIYASNDVINEEVLTSNINTIKSFGNIETIFLGTCNFINATNQICESDFICRRISIKTTCEAVDFINSSVNEFFGNDVVFLDAGVEINRELLEIMLSRLQRVDIGAVGPLIKYADSMVCSSGICVNLPKPTHINRGLSDDFAGYMDFKNCEVNYTAISGKCLATKKQILIEAGGLCNDYKSHYIDVDYCLRLREINKLVLYTPLAEATYHGEFVIHKQKNKNWRLDEIVDRMALINNWKSFFKHGDPYINNNLMSTSDTFSFLPRT